LSAVICGWALCEKDSRRAQLLPETRSRREGVRSRGTSGRGGKAEPDPRAGSGVGEPDATAVSFDDRARDREPEAGARARAGGVGAAAVERREHVLALLGADPVAGVGDLE